MKKRIVYITISVLVCLAIGFLASIATQSSVNDWYVTLNKPSFTPPNYLFAPVWTALYIMMGIAAGIVWSKGYHHIWVKTALYHFVFQLLLNALWSIVFFGLKNPLGGMIVILALLTMIILTIKWFKVISKPAALLMIPYVLWVAFASALNYKIWELNG
ncbi:MAG: TspO/MBR family protein [Bacteroidota bacterium]|uniref:Tryptophan-rich sensory protein n=1 Tax=Flagellimonas profundi TaxID=2915620 RepID=A0ABS3FJC6_9FLAO|nr:TspO/MBR family protein [Allomuricauda profundi]MBO0343212.1 tryptophan-rich sensory protein [Allomuricauda profundi]MEC7770444.1 TspO/MBR family protein [Bacteroidota bacterium]